MQNRYIIEGDVVKVFLPRYDGSEEVAIISIDSLDRVSEFPNTWFYVRGHGNCNYVQGTCIRDGKKTTIKLHRWIMDKELTFWKTKYPNDKFDIDHLDGNGLNNTVDNIWVCTHNENLDNRGENRIYNKKYINELRKRRRQEYGKV